MKPARIFHAILSLGLSELIGKLRSSKWGKLLLIMIVLNEIRGLAMAYGGAKLYFGF